MQNTEKPTKPHEVLFVSFYFNGHFQCSILSTDLMLELHITGLKFDRELRETVH